jgi:hypothetical protein
LYGEDIDFENEEYLRDFVRSNLAEWGDSYLNLGGYKKDLDSGLLDAEEKTLGVMTG